MRRLVAPLLVAAALVVAQGAIVLTAGAPSLAASRPSGPVAGAGGAGSALGTGASVDLATSGRLDGSAGIAHLASVTAARATTADPTTQTPAGATTERKAEREGPAYSYPVTWGTPISGGFGDVSSSWPRGHAGLDFNGDTGDPVYAATPVRTCTSRCAWARRSRRPIPRGCGRGRARECRPSHLPGPVATSAA